MTTPPAEPVVGGMLPEEIPRYEQYWSPPERLGDAAQFGLRAAPDGAWVSYADHLAAIQHAVGGAREETVERCCAAICLYCRDGIAIRWNLGRWMHDNDELCPAGRLHLQRVRQNGASVAQLAEQGAFTPEAAGSTPATGTLRPCPFCGATEAALHTILPRARRGRMRFARSGWVFCGHCGAQGPFGDHIDDVRREWNGIASTPPSPPNAGGGDA